MSANITEETIKMVKSANADVSKAITTAAGLTAISLEAPSKKLFPVHSPLRNRFSRRPGRGSAAAWRAITAINSGNLDVAVGEGLRNAEVVTNTVSRSAPFKSIGQDDSVTDEATWQAMEFEDIRAMAQANLLSSVMVGEERTILGGLTSFALGAPAAPTVVTAATGGSIPAGTYNVVCMPLTYRGAQFSTLTDVNGTPSGANHGAASPATSTGALSGTDNVISASVPVVNGAMSYIWFVGVAGSERAQAITRTNSVSLTSLSATNQLLSTVAGDTSQNALAFDGIISQILIPGSGAQVIAMPTGTLGVGTPLTPDGAGGVVEINTLLRSLWDTVNVGPTQLVVNSREADAITAAVIAGGGASLLRAAPRSIGPSQIEAGVGVTAYYNKSTGQSIPIMIHPYMPQGTILALTESLPYANSNVPNVFEMEVLREYHALEYARTQRKYEFGVYASEVLKVYFPAGQGLIANIGA